MLAPMQGLTNRALRAQFIERYHPDLVFTEFVRASASSKRCISQSDRLEVAEGAGAVPLVVQLIGSDTDALEQAAQIVQDLGAQHLNINLGCPYGRMTSNTAGGRMLKEPEKLEPILRRLRGVCGGSFSVKTRSGFDDPSQIFSLLPMFEACGVDFLVLHPRTVVQRYEGRADHSVTAGVVAQTRLPVIANGDVVDADGGLRVLAETGAAGLMLGRGAIADPLLFERLRGNYPELSSPAERRRELRSYLEDLVERYRLLFSGDQQVLTKMKEITGFAGGADFAETRRQLLRSKKLQHYSEILATLE